MTTPNAFLVLVTTEPIDPEKYSEVATKLIETLHKLTQTKLTEFTKPHLTEPWCDVEVSIDSENIVHTAMILLAWAPKSWSLDKNKLTSLLRAELPFTVKLTKRTVDKNELERILEKVATEQPKVTKDLNQDQPA